MALFFRPEVRKRRRFGVDARLQRKGSGTTIAVRSVVVRVLQRSHGFARTAGASLNLSSNLVERGQGKFCSLDCYRSQTPRVERVCQICGKVFAVKAYYAAAGWGQFCGEECQHRSYEAKHATRTCQVCGKEFSVIQAVAKKKDSAKYCSKECRDAARRDYVTIVCEGCGKQVFIPRFEVNRGRGKFCSRECWEKRIDAKVTLACANCGREFETWKSQIEHRGRRFCSRRCYQLYEGESSIEELIRIELERRGEEFIQEAEVGPYQVDFWLPRRNTVVECDGSYWHSLIDSIVRDRRKDT
jgi:hypothetical protein